MFSFHCFLLSGVGVVLLENIWYSIVHGDWRLRWNSKILLLMSPLQQQRLADFELYKFRLSRAPQGLRLWVCGFCPPPTGVENGLWCLAPTVASHEGGILWILSPKTDELLFFKGRIIPIISDYTFFLFYGNTCAHPFPSFPLKYWSN